MIASDGAVRSVQSALLTMPQADLRRLWNRASLEDLGRTYWRFLSRSMLGLVRVRYTADERAVVLIARPLTLLRFDAPEYEFHSRRGRISWRIRDGLLVSRRAGRGSGWLSLDVQSEDPTIDPARLLIEVEVANFYPSIASRIGTAVYKSTQAFVHVTVTHAFLRSLARLDLAHSKVRRFSGDTDTSVESPASTSDRAA